MSVGDVCGGEIDSDQEKPKVYSRDTRGGGIEIFLRVSVSVPPEFFFGVSTSADRGKSNLTAIATWTGEMRPTHSHIHFGYSKHGQGNGAVLPMDDNKHRSGDQWVGIEYTTKSKCTTD